jgi:hypothetical protein
LYQKLDLLSTFYKLSFRIAEFILIVRTIGFSAGLVHSNVTLFLFEQIVNKSTRFAQTVCFKQHLSVIIMSQLVLGVQVKALIFHEQLL